MERYEKIKKVIKDSQGIVNSKFLKENAISNYYINKLLKDKLIERIESKEGIHTIEAAADLGYGSREYELISID